MRFFLIDFLILFYGKTIKRYFNVMESFRESKKYSIANCSYFESIMLKDDDYNHELEDYCFKIVDNFIMRTKFYIFEMLKDLIG